jgi:hypothetical protein
VAWSGLELCDLGRIPRLSPLHAQACICQGAEIRPDLGRPIKIYRADRHNVSTGIRGVDFLPGTKPK